MGHHPDISPLLQCQALIDGQWTHGQATGRFDVCNPATGEVLAGLPDLGPEDARVAIEAAGRAMTRWRQATGHERAAVLKAWHALVLQEQETLATLMTLEQGKILAEARAEVAYGAAYIEWFAEEAKRLYGDTLPLPQPGQRGMTVRQPVGVVAAITPWNFPVAMVTRKLAPALAAGCAVVLKPSEETPLCALALAQLAEQAGVPAGLVNVLPSTRAADIGAVLTSHPLVRKLSFTGSTRVGKLLAQQCTASVKRTSMELGGNAPLLVFADADIDHAVDAAVASRFRNSGQTCICTNRILVQEDVADAFTNALVARVAALRTGDGLNNANSQGPLINAAALTKMQSLVERAQQQGATLAAGGTIPGDGTSGHFYLPTVLTGVTPQMDIFSEEIFGPIATVIPFTDEEHGVALANDTDHGLAAYLFTQNLARGFRVSEALAFGMVGVNETAITSEVIPFGGVKESGSGKEGSKYGLQDYTDLKYICFGDIQRTDT